MTDRSRPDEPDRVVIHDRRRIDPITGEVRHPDPDPAADRATSVAPPLPGVGRSSEAELAERTADLQRLQAEFANYRKRVDRDRVTVVEMAQDVLHDLLRQADRKVTVDEIQQRVAAHYNIKLAEMSSPRRARSVARPRQVAMYLAKQLTTLSLPQIGKRFGNRDHTTVMHAVRKIEELKISDLSIAEDVELLKRQLQG